MTKVVVIDDDPSTTTLVRMLLEMEGFEVATGPNRSLAMKATGADVAAFIIDCNLANNESGLDLLRAIRQGETVAARDVPAILVSGDQRMEKEALAIGADIFLLKPYSPNHLSELVHQLITQRK